MCRRFKVIKAREILDSRGNPTIAAEVILADGTIGDSRCAGRYQHGKYESQGTP